MMHVELHTTTGHYVTTAVMPPFQRLPEAIMWGSRVFFKPYVPHMERLIYTEGFMIAAVETKDETLEERHVREREMGI